MVLWIASSKKATHGCVMGLVAFKGVVCSLVLMTNKGYEKLQNQKGKITM
jgi:hypothetical protein